MMYFCPKIVMMSAGTRARTAVALIRFHSIPSSWTNCAMTTVSTGVFEAVRSSAKRNSFQVKSQQRTASAVRPGIALGRATRKKAPQRVQPSISAACSIEGSIASKNPFISQEKKQMWTATWGRISPQYVS
jgi:hypothetical protein